MKKVILTVAIAIVGSFSAMAQNTNAQIAQNGKKLVTDAEDGVTYLTTVTPKAGGGAQFDISPDKIIGLAMAATRPGGIRIVTGPSIRTEYPDGSATKHCYNTNNWPCMIMRGSAAE